MTAPSWMSLRSIALHSPDDPPARLWPEDADEAYITARRALDAEEAELLDHVERVAARRRALPPGPVIGPYPLTEGARDLAADGPEVTVTPADLFGEHGTLVIYHLMFHPDDDQSCPMCALWVDGLHGVAHHLSRRTALAVIGKAPLPALRRWARHRGWQRLRIVSSFGTTFNADLGVETPGGGQNPAVSVLRRDADGAVRHVLTQSADLLNGHGRGIDLLSPVWQVLDLLPEGRQEWLPDNDYPGAGRG